MIVHGREVKFLRTVWAMNEIAKVCPMQNVNRLNEKLKSESTVEVNEVWATFISALSTGYEMSRKYEEKGYKPNPVTVEELFTLSEEDFTQMITEAMEAWFGDKVTVEVEESKKKEKISGTSD